jgi:hypothetical protein
LDLATGLFKEFLVQPDLISEDYRYLISIDDFQEIKVYDTRTHQTKVVVSETWPTTFADQSYGPVEGLSGGMGWGNMQLSDHKLHYTLYNAREHTRDDVASYDLIKTQTIDLDSYFQ